MRKPFAILLPILALLAAACGSSSTTTATSVTQPGALRLSVRTLPGLGPVLVNGQGRTLYVFEPDKAKSVTCVGGCAAVWPPLSLSSNRKPAVSAGVNAGLVSSDLNPSGGRVVTYAGWPLYLYVSDPNPGSAHGQGLNVNGGLWYVIAPSGKVVKKAVPHGAGASSSSGSPY